MVFSGENGYNEDGVSSLTLAVPTRNMFDIKLESIAVDSSFLLPFALTEILDRLV